MLDWKGHLKMGVLASVVLIFILFFLDYYANMNFLSFNIEDCMDFAGLSVPIIVIAVPVLLYCSVLPDIDIGTSKVYHFTVASLLVLAIFFVATDRYQWETIAILVFLFLILFLEHRGVAHNPIVGIIIGIFFGIIFGGSIVVGFFATIGFFTHLVADMKYAE